MMQEYKNQVVGFVSINRRPIVKATMTVVGAVLGFVASAVVNNVLDENESFANDDVEPDPMNEAVN